jgi:hypothetical protein
MRLAIRNVTKSHLEHWTVALALVLTALAPSAARAEHSNPLLVGGPRHPMPWRAPGTITPQSAPVGAHLTYYGGRVVSNMQVVQVLWGTGSYFPQVSSTTSPSIATFFQEVLNSAHVDWLDGEYNTVTNSNGGISTLQHIGRGSFLVQVTITPSVANNGSTITDAQIQAELVAQIAAGVLPPPTTDSGGNNNTYYAVYFPHGKTLTQGGTSSCVSGGFCAYHGTLNFGSHGEIYYGVHPDMQVGSGCDTGCGSGTPFANYTSVASHEMVETITDCEVGVATVVGPPLAWYDNTNGEIGDICNGQQGTIVGSDGVTYTVQKEFSNSATDCIVGNPPLSDFSVSASPSALTVQAGSSGTVTVSTSVVAGSAESISLSTSGLPAGVTVSFTPASVSSGQNSTMTVTASASAAASISSVTITGSATTGTHTTTVSLTVLAAPPSDFSISASPSSISVAAGGSAVSTIATAITSGSAETVSLSASGLPSGVTVSFNPASVSSGQSSTMTVAAAASAAASISSITIMGSASTGPHATTVSLTVIAAPPSDFSISASPSSISVAAGGSAVSSIATAITSGSAETVSLSASGLPAGVTVSFTPASVSSGQSATMTVTAAASAAASISSLTITGSAGTGTHATTVSLTVIAAPPSDFSVSVRQALAFVQQGRAASIAVSTAVISGAAQTVNLSVTGLPPGTVAQFVPASFAAGGKSVLSLSVGRATRSGLYPLKVVATGITATHATTVWLAVIPR